VQKFQSIEAAPEARHRDQQERIRGRRIGQDIEPAREAVRRWEPPKTLTRTSPSQPLYTNRS
jgi:hypothetical protein